MTDEYQNVKYLFTVEVFWGENVFVLLLIILIIIYENKANKFLNYYSILKIKKINEK